MLHRVRGAILIVAAMAVPALAQPDEGEAKQEPPPEPPPEPPRPPPPAPEPAPEPRFDWGPFGFVRMQYVAIQNDPNVPFIGRNDGFQLQNARIGLRGMLDQRARFVVSFDGAVDRRSGPNVPQGRLEVDVRDAFVDLAIGGGSLAGPDSVWIVKGGFFQTWIDPQTQVPDTEREFIDRPLESRGIRATEGFEADQLTPQRSPGLALRLDPPFSNRAFAGAPGGRIPVAPKTTLGLELAVQNGANELASNNDNDLPAISLAALARLANGGHAVIGARYNPRTVGELPALRDETDLQATGGMRLLFGPLTVGGGVAFTRTTFPSTGGPVQNAFGMHAQIGARFGVTRNPTVIGYRFGLFDPSSLLVTDRVMEHTVGAAFGVPRYRMRVQFQLTHVIEQAERTLSNSRAQAAVEVAL